MMKAVNLLQDWLSVEQPHCYWEKLHSAVLSFSRQHFIISYSHSTLRTLLFCRSRLPFADTTYATHSLDSPSRYLEKFQSSGLIIAKISQSSCSDERKFINWKKNFYIKDEIDYLVFPKSNKFLKLKKYV